MSLDNNPITLSFDKYVDMDYLNRCNSPKEIYGYLKSIDLAKLENTNYFNDYANIIYNVLKNNS